MSWAMPSVTMIAPPTRSGGVSRSASRSAPNRRVALIVGIVARRLDEARLDIAEFGEPLLDLLRAPRRSAPRARRAGSARERSMTTATTSFSGLRSSRCSVGSSSATSSSAATSAAQEAPRAAGARASGRRRRPRQRRAARPARASAAAARRRRTRRSMREPFEQVLGVNLVGLVVAGQRVHHEIDAAAQREFALARRRRAPADRAAGRRSSAAQAPARSLDVMMIGETLSPARAGRETRSLGSGGGSASIQVCPMSVRPTKPSSR